MADDDSTFEGPVSSFQSLAAEGDILAKQGEYRKAIDAYTKALILRPIDKTCLVARSKCYLQLGDPQSALKDAELALKEDKDFFKGKFQKAEALYAMGDFEMALVYYHRGHKLRPELDEFRLGIQKAREAIDNSIGNPKDYKLQSPKTWMTDGLLTGKAGKPGTASGMKRTQIQTTTDFRRNLRSAKSEKAERTEKQLLGELYADKEYLQSLLDDRDFIKSPKDTIYELVSEGLRYLETRTEFWRQQKPIYARKKEASRIQARVNHAKHRQQAAQQQRESKASVPKTPAVRGAATKAKGKGGKVAASGSTGVRSADGIMA